MGETLLLRGISGLGLVALLGLAWLLSEHRASPPWRVAAWGIGLQVCLAVLVLLTPFGQPFFAAVRAGFDAISNASLEGARFVFGNLTQFFVIERVLTPGPEGLQPVEPFPIAGLIAFQVLPTIIFVAGLAAVLQHLGIIQRLIGAMAWIMRRTMRTSGAETFSAALEVFMGIEATSALGPYIARMTRSELFSIMSCYLATIAASVMVAYAGFGAEPGHLLAASLMGAPAALVISKIMIPEREQPETQDAHFAMQPSGAANIFDAAGQGAVLGLQMALNVGALLIVFIGLIHLLDGMAVGITGISISDLLGWFFRPFAFLMGVPWVDIPEVARLLAVKTFFNEFIAYQQLQGLIAQQGISPRAIAISTYALCGFANPGSLGIMIGALDAMAPGRRAEVASLALRALIAGTLATFSTACIAGMLVSE